jgi:hypothetical protein
MTTDSPQKEYYSRWSPLWCIHLKNGELLHLIREEPESLDQVPSLMLDLYAADGEGPHATLSLRIDDLEEVIHQLKVVEQLYIDCAQHDQNRVPKPNWGGLEKRTRDIELCPPLGEWPASQRQTARSPEQQNGGTR